MYFIVQYMHVFSTYMFLFILYFTYPYVPIYSFIYYNKKKVVVVVVGHNY